MRLTKFLLSQIVPFFEAKQHVSLAKQVAEHVTDRIKSFIPRAIVGILAGVFFLIGFCFAFSDLMYQLNEFGNIELSAALLLPIGLMVLAIASYVVTAIVMRQRKQQPLIEEAKESVHNIQDMAREVMHEAQSIGSHLAALIWEELANERREARHIREQELHEERLYETYGDMPPEKLRPENRKVS